MHEPPVRPRTPEHGDGEEGWDDVGDASMDSFPASDPPPWMGMRVGGPPRRSASDAGGRAGGEDWEVTSVISRGNS
jgi:hypothetical protein